MILIKHNQEELIFKTAPVVIKKINRLGVIILSLCLIYLPVLLYNADFKKLECNRQNLTQISCHLSEKKLLGLITIRDININNLSTVQLKNNRVFINDNIYWSDYGIDEIKLNNMINNFNQRNLIINYNHLLTNIFNIIIFYPWLIILCLRMKNWPGNYLIFQKKEQKLLENKTNIKGQIVNEISFNQIKTIDKIEKINRNGEKIYQISVILKTLNLRDTIWIDNIKNEKQATDLVKLLNNFIDL